MTKLLLTNKEHQSVDDTYVGIKYVTLTDANSVQISNMSERKFDSLFIIICIFAKVSGDHIYEQDTTPLTADFIYQASVHFNYNDEFLCGGAVVSSHEVLTAGSCLFYNWGGVIPPIILSVKIGGTDLNEDRFQILDVSNVIFHDKFDSGTLQYDLAVINTSETLQSSKFAIGSISLAKQSAFVSYNVCTITGWNKETKYIQAINAEVVDCDPFYSKKICALPLGLNTLCQFSLGSLLVCNDTLLGILSVEPVDCNLPNEKLIFELASYAKNIIDGDSVTFFTNRTEILQLPKLLHVLLGTLLFLFNLFIS